MARTPEDQEVPGDIGKRETERHANFVRISGTKRKQGAQPGNQNRLKHGIFANKFLTAEEKPLFQGIIAKLYQDFVFNKSSDFIQVELVAIYFLKLGRAQEAGDWENAEKIDRMIRCHLKDLKATKISREGEQPKGPESTPADWATSLLEKASAPNAEKSTAAAGDSEETRE